MTLSELIDARAKVPCQITDCANCGFDRHLIIGTHTYTICTILWMLEDAAKEMGDRRWITGT
jgi:hypothetical protein